MTVFYKSQGKAALLLWVAASSIALSACVKPTDYVTPSMQLADKYSVVVPVRGQAIEDDQWWMAFDDPVLNALVTEALSENLSLAQARWRVNEAEADLRRARNGMSGDARVEVENADGDDTAALGLTAIFDIFGQRRARSAAAAARLDASRFGEMDDRRLLVLELTRAYVDLRFQQQSLAERQRDLTSRRQTLRDIITQRDTGAATELDVIRSQALVSELQAEIPGIGAETIRQRNRISTLAGKPVGELGVDLSFQGRQPNPKDMAAAGVPADLLRNRPDIRQAERAYAAAISDIDEARANRYPRLSLSGVIQAPLDGNGSSDSLSAGILIPVFNQGALGAQADAADARANQAYLQWRRTVLIAVEEAETSLASLHASYHAVAAARDVVRLNEESLDLTRKLLDQSGNITVLDLLDRERTLTNSRTALARTQRDVALNFAELRAALGSSATLYNLPDN